jgi:muramoyltetrapeptide carboxypeptidase LdcA involved in peptidoglycan recycling
MNSNIFPKKLKSGDEVRIIAPSCAKATLGSGVIEKGESELRRLGLRVSWGAHTHIVDELDCAPVAARVEDLHEAFLDPEVKAILAVRGGFYANQLLGHIDFSVIKNNPKIFCGFSDITVLQNAILARTGLVSYSGPNLSYIGKSKLLDYTIDYLRRCLFEDEAFTVDQALSYQNFGPHFGDEVVANPGWVPLVAGVAEGVIVGGNLCTFNLLQGTSYMPSLQNAVLFLEDDASSEYKDFDRNFQSLLHLPDFASVRGIVFEEAGRPVEWRVLDGWLLSQL